MSDGNLKTLERTSNVVAVPIINYIVKDFVKRRNEQKQP